MNSSSNNLLFDLKKNTYVVPRPMNEFDRDLPWIMLTFTMVFFICGGVSGYATFTGIRLFLQEVGDIGMLVNGTSIILTVAIVAILTIGWSALCRYGPEARTGFLKFMMMNLGAALLAITICVSSLPNMIGLVGPAAKISSWNDQRADALLVLNAYGNRALSVAGLTATWQAERDKLCRLAKAETEGGAVSLAGAGSGPVAAALIGACEQTSSFIASAEEAFADTEAAIASGRAALRDMRTTIKDRSTSVIDREDRFLEAGDRLNTAIQKVQAADLTRVLEAGAEQVRLSIAELSAESTFSPKQVEMVAATRAGLNGLVTSVRTISAQWDKADMPDYAPVDSPDFIAAIFSQWQRYIPIVAAAIGIDCFQVWALFFLLVGKAGKDRFRQRGDYEEYLNSDRFVPLTAMAPPMDTPTRRRWWPFNRTSNHSFTQ